MRNTITKTVSMLLVTVMVLGVISMPFRIFAGQAEIADMASPALEQIVKLNNASASDDEEAKQILKALFPIYDPDIPVASVSISDLEGLAKTLSRNGISAVFDAKYCPQFSQEVWYLTCESIDSFPVNIFGQYAPGGRYVVAVPDGSSSAEQSTDKYSGHSKTEIKQVFDNSTNTWVDVEVTNIDQSTTNNSVSVDFKSGTFYDVNGGTLNVFDKLVYNPVTQTYDVTFTDNRHYTYQFYYDYTYITYIGSSAEYREAYKVYYELPDGRSSGDLTVDELKGLSLQFDMVNYDKAASDTLTHALYSFDGNVNNSSYFDSNFTWVSNASTEYLESPDGFGGSLFVDPSNTETRFNISFPQIGTSDPTSSESVLSSFTLQFRLYFTHPLTSSLIIALNGSWNGYYSHRPTTDLSNWVNPYKLYHSTNRAYLLAAFASDGLNSYYIEPGSTSSTKHSYSTINPGSWYDITICYYRDFPWISTGSPVSPGHYYFYVNGLLVGTTPVYGFDPNSSSDNILTQRYWTASGEVTSGSSFSPVVPYSLNGIYFIARSGGSPFQIDNLRFVSTALYTGVRSFTPTPVPFDTNLVYVLPSVADLNDNTVAIMSQLPVSGYRVGGIRPTDPTLAAGYVYMHIYGDFVDSVQQWNGSYWEEVTAWLYTGIRWIPVTAFNVFTLEDMFDIIDPDADGSGDNVDDIYKYYLWWSGEWGSFQQWLQGTMQTLIEAIQASGGSGGGSDVPVVIVPGYNDQTTTSEITRENPDGSTTKTTIVSNAAGLVYSNSVTTYPTDANGNTKTITVYTDSSGVMYQTETMIDKDGNVTVTEPTKATGTLGSILKMITKGVMSIAGTVIEGFVTIVSDGVKFIIESADSLIDGVGSIIGSLASSITDFAGTVQDNLDQPGVNPVVDGDDEEPGGGAVVQTYNFFDVFFDVLPPEIVTALTLCFVVMIALPIINKIHF